MGGAQEMERSPVLETDEMEGENGTPLNDDDDDEEEDMER